MKRWTALLLSAVLCLSLSACASTTAEEAPETSAPIVETEPVIETTAPVETEPTEAEPAETDLIEAEIAEETPVAETEAIDEDSIGLTLNAENIATETFTMTFDSLRIVDEYSYNTGASSIMSIYVESGYKLLVLEGHAENLGTSTIPTNAFFCTAVFNGEYEVTSESMQDVQVEFIRDQYYEIDPYTDKDYVISFMIPEKLADMVESVTISIGFNNDFSVVPLMYDVDNNLVTETDQKYTITGEIASEETAVETEATTEPMD